MRRIEHMPLHAIPRAVRNPKEHDLEAIRRSVEAFGCIVAGELDERTGRLVVGHGRLQVLEAMAADKVSPPEGVLVDDDGTWKVPIVRGWSSRSDADAEAYLIANNHTTERGGWEDQILAEVLADVRDADPDLLLAAGYTDDDLADLADAIAGADGSDREEELPEPGDADEDVRPEVWGIVVTCDGEEEQTRLLERLADEGWQVRALM
jgi:ParB-like chromosome segregation protein Spo0J